MKWEIVWSYSEFCEYIEKYYQNNSRLPEIISFDHDLAEEHYYYRNAPIPYSKFVKKTGYDCARWLVEFSVRNKIKLPKYKIYTMNFGGEENIINEFEKAENKQ